MADEITNYRLHINKINQEACNLHIRCSFSLNFQDADSVSMNFGGGQEFSIERILLSVCSEHIYECYHECGNTGFSVPNMLLSSEV